MSEVSFPWAIGLWCAIVILTVSRRTLEGGKEPISCYWSHSWSRVKNGCVNGKCPIGTDAKTSSRENSKSRLSLLHSRSLHSPRPQLLQLFRGGRDTPGWLCWSGKVGWDGLDGLDGRAGWSLTLALYVYTVYIYPYVYIYIFIYKCKLYIVYSTVHTNTL